MSSWKNVSKSKARSHKERSQPRSRRHLGLLEKKKDYKERAIDAHKKESTLKYLEQKALDRNPDEFYFKMVTTVKKDGEHMLRQDKKVHSQEELNLMYTQDQRYVNMKRSAELKKIERLKSSLHMIDTEDKPQNKHIIFVDNKKQAKEFNAAEHFKTHPALVGRRFNRPTMESLQSGQFADLNIDNKATSKKRHKYKELKKRIEREKHLKTISLKMETKKHLLKERDLKKKKVAKETKDRPAQYKWEFKRKR
ncbi:UTP11-like [Mactra antiquata]